MFRSSSKIVTTVVATLLASLSFVLSAAPALAGPFTESGVDSGSVVAWASGVSDFARGPQDIANPAGPLATFGVDTHATGSADGSLVSLGDGGSITLEFDILLRNDAGADFAVWENGFESGGGLFAELGFVDVSSDGLNFARFASESLTPAPVGPFSAIDPTDVRDLAGRHAAGTGTGFDLEELLADPLVIGGVVDLSAIRFVRITDVVGDGSTFDSMGRPIYDPYATPFSSSVLDLDAVGALNIVPEPGTALLMGLGLVGLGWGGRRR
ncbi:MAG: PEP-CTERM sorting domain-containing protein [bacterium]|nr:PEP-CTERM sorting domain-containing protein [bacterium]